MGTHPSALPGETLALAGAIDAVAVGEADYTLRELAQRLSKSDAKRITSDPTYRESVLQSISGLAWRSGNRITINRKRDFIEDLDGLPFVSRVYKKHLDVKKYFFAASDYPEIQIMTARGCVARCTFCVYPQTIHGWKYRMRSAKSIADEFQWVVENLPEVREIGIEDDTFTGSQKRTIEFCLELIERNIRIKWYCNVRVDLKYETMEWMRKAGLLVHGCFMAGNRGETKETLEKSLQMSLRLMDDTMQFFPLMVYPGTKDYEWAKKEGLLTAHSWAAYLTGDGNHNSVLRMPDMDSDEIREWCNDARRRYYLRPRYLFYKLLQQLRHPSEMRRTFKAAKRFIRFLKPGAKPC
jgi:radical SAM superfamily enzyme YgiQ (UPF0313 family)